MYEAYPACNVKTIGVICSNYINKAECVSLAEFIVREILVEILVCHIISWVALIRKQLSSQDEENIVQTRARSSKRVVVVLEVYLS